MKGEFFNTANSRFLFLQQSNIHWDPLLILNKIDEWLLNQSSFQLANQVGYCYFFSHPEDELFNSDHHWVGREVIGWSEDVSHFETADFVSLPYCRFELGSLAENRWIDLTNLYQSAHKWLFDEGYSMTNQWRIGRLAVWNNQSVLKFNIFLDIFLMPE